MFTSVVIAAVAIFVLLIIVGGLYLWLVRPFYDEDDTEIYTEPEQEIIDAVGYFRAIHEVFADIPDTGRTWLEIEEEKRQAFRKEMGL